MKIIQIHNNNYKRKTNKKKTVMEGILPRGYCQAIEQCCSSIFDKHLTESCWSRLRVACLTVRPLQIVVRAAMVWSVERLDGVQTSRVSNTKG